MISETCVFLVLVAFILIWLFIQSTVEPFEGVLAKEIPYVPEFTDLRGITLPTQHAYYRYNDENLYNVISDTGAFIYEDNYDPRKYTNCHTVTCPNSHDTRFCGDVCLNCRRAQ